ncbi:hypothetical protein FIBSPDRAFT_963272 [Athelia psychrophila]|uniref:Iminophenyl-pyruvate dimer synthase domain-containing protein n=1 Tax=Athelia psychrophila TaxID=1759441 RepID=A0A165Z6X7_9AGAM|nr:hypothetical protein FIBSPDRAFT_963272 [Fibularhizoctonia sp. CBS 109695]
MPAPNRPVHEPPRRPPDWKNMPVLDGIAELKRHLHTAMLVELYTIPLYLFAAYSIIPGASEPTAFSAILGIVRQEMLHLGLAGNILRAIGGKPLIYGPGITPHYPVDLFYHQTVKMDLKSATKDHIGVFVAVEAPVEGPAEIVSASLGSEIGILSNYGSIAEFYEETRNGLNIVSNKYTVENPGKTIWDNSEAGNQFQASDGSWHSSDMLAIRDLKSADDSIELIIEQGEGAMLGSSSTANYGPSHWEIFKTIHEGPELDCYTVVKNPVTSDYEKSVPKVYKVMLASDAVYSYLLLTMEKLWQHEGTVEERNPIVQANMRDLMGQIMKPFAEFLVTLKVDETVHAAAPFNLYTFKKGSSACEQLKTLFKEAVQAYGKLGDLQKWIDALIDIEI